MISLLLAQIKKDPSTPALLKRIKDICDRRTKVLARLGWLPFTPVTGASKETQSAEPSSNRVQDTSLLENNRNGQRSPSVTMVSPAQLSAKMQARNVDYVERMKISVVRPGRITIPLTPKDLAPLSRRWGNQKVEAEDAQFESMSCITANTQPLQRPNKRQSQFTLVPHMSADTTPHQRRSKRQKTEVEDMQIQSFHKMSDAVVWHRVPSGMTWSHRNHWNQS